MEQALAGGPVTVPMPRSSAVAAIGNGLRSHPPRQHRTVRREGQLGPRPAVMKPEIHRAKTLYPGFHGAPAGPAYTDRDADGVSVT